MKKIAVGIPAYKAEGHICDCLASIQIQTMVDDVEVIIAKDNPSDNYDFVKERFPHIDITILDCNKNTGPGLARQRCLDNATAEWITFIDADDVFFSPYALEDLYSSAENNAIEVQGIFMQALTKEEQAIKNMKMIPMENVDHPWVFGRLYRIQFLKENKIGFSSLRAMEDGEFNWKIKMTIEGSEFVIKVINAPIYLWREGSEHSITRIEDDDSNIPQYNFDLCVLGTTEASINAVNFVRKSNAFNGAINRFVVEQMIGLYFTYIECVERKPVFAEQNLYNAKKFYHECYKQIEHLVDDNTLKRVYTILRAQEGQSLVNIIPSIAFYDFMDKIKTDEYGGDDELKEIRSRLPQKIIDNDLKTGVLGGEKCL